MYTIPNITQLKMLVPNVKLHFGVEMYLISRGSFQCTLGAWELSLSAVVTFALFAIQTLLLQWKTRNTKGVLIFSPSSIFPRGSRFQHKPLLLMSTLPLFPFSDQILNDKVVHYCSEAPLVNIYYYHCWGLYFESFSISQNCLKYKGNLYFTKMNISCSNLLSSITLRVYKIESKHSTTRWQNKPFISRQRHIFKRKKSPILNYIIYLQREK